MALKKLKGKANREEPQVTLSRKNQITLPVRVLRELGLRSGDRFQVHAEEGRIVLRPQPRDWVSFLAGSMPGYYGKTKEEIDAYLAEVRGEWGSYLSEKGEESSIKA